MKLFRQLLVFVVLALCAFASAQISEPKFTAEELKWHNEQVALADSAWTKKDYKVAVEIYTKICDRFKSDYGCHNSLGILYLEQNQEAKCLEVFRSFSKNNADDPNRNVLEALYWLVKEDFKPIPDLIEPVIKDVKADAKIKPDYLLYKILVITYYRTDKLGEAKRVAQASIKMWPDNEKAKEDLKIIEAEIAMREKAKSEEKKPEVKG